MTTDFSELEAARRQINETESARLKEIQKCSEKIREIEAEHKDHVNRLKQTHFDAIQLLKEEKDDQIQRLKVASCES